MLTKWILVVYMYGNMYVPTLEYQTETKCHTAMHQVSGYPETTVVPKGVKLAYCVAQTEFFKI